MLSFVFGETKILKVTFKDDGENVTPLTGAVAWTEEHGMFDPLSIQLAAVAGEPDKIAATAIAVGPGKIKAAVALPVSGYVQAEEPYTVSAGLPTHGVISVV
jgi:hypothetical protein